MTGLTDEEKIQKVLQHRADVRESERCYEKHYGLFQLTQMTRIRMEQFSDKLRFPTLIGYKYGIDKDTIEVVFDALAFNEVTYNGNLMDEMARALRAPIPERISGLTGAVRYLTHMDNPEKYQYDNTEIQVFGGFDLESCLALSTGDKRQALKEMLGFISDNNIMHLKDFADYCMSDRAPAGWFELLTERNTLFIKEYIKSNWQKENQVYKE